jgi:hypothetical protein
MQGRALGEDANRRIYITDKAIDAICNFSRRLEGEAVGAVQSIRKIFETEKLFIILHVGRMINNKYSQRAITKYNLNSLLSNLALSMNSDKLHVWQS